MKKIKQILSLLLAFCTVLSAGTFPAIAEGEASTASASTNTVTPPTVTSPILPKFTGTNTDILYTDTYNDCILMTVKGTDENAFGDYLGVLQSTGYSTISATRTILGTSHKQAIYANDSYLINAVYVADTKEAKITVEPRNGLDLAVFTSANATAGDVEPLLIQMGLDSVDGSSVQSNGMCYIYRLSDGRFVIYDGGEENTSENHVERIYTTLHQYMPTTGGYANKIVIAAWFITHPHTDHIGAMIGFTKAYLGNPGYDHVSLEKVICNLPNIDTQTYQYENRTENQRLTASTIEKYNTHLTELAADGVDVYKAHVGQMYYIGNLTIEILFTYDLISPDDKVVNQKALTDELLPITDKDGNVLIPLIDAVNLDGTPYYENGARPKALQGYYVTVNGVTVPLTYTLENHYTNSFSVISRVTMTVDGEKHSAIFTGDATNIGISTVNRMYGENMKSEFVQVPHHGATSQFKRYETVDGVAQLPENEYVKQSNGTYSTTPTDPETYYADEMALDLFFGDNTSQSGIPTDNHYYRLYDSDGYGNVRATYVLWPTSKVSGPYASIAKTGFRRTTWHPIYHLAVEVGEKNCIVAGSSITVFSFDGKTVTVTTPTENPFADMTMGSGNAYSPYEVSTLAELQTLITANPAAHCILTSDIEVTVTDSTTFPLINVSYKGTLDGNGHVINFDYSKDSNKTVEISVNDVGAIFSKIQGTVKDLKIKNVAITSTGTAGAQIGVIASSTTGTTTFENVELLAITIDNKATGNRNIGGFVGNVGSNATFKNCVFNGTIGFTNTIGTAGGFIGRANGSGTITITQNSTVSGSISAYTNAGGFIGYLASSKILNMSRGGTNNSPTNYASVTSTTRAGGIIGAVVGTKAAYIAPKITLNHIINNGNVTGGSAGGFIGNVQYVENGADRNGVANDYTIRLYNGCVNNGNVIAASDKNAGGAIACIQNSNTTDTDKDIIVKMEAFTNNGTVKGSNASGAVGYEDTITNGSVTISDSSNYGDITATNSAAGFYAHHKTTSGTYVIKNCTNYGNVASSGQRAGGIAAHFGGTANLTVTGCVNMGMIKSTATTGTATTNAATIVCAAFGTTTITNCVNLGSREGWKSKTEGETTVYVKDATPAITISPVAKDSWNCKDFAIDSSSTAYVDSSVDVIKVLSDATARVASANERGIRFSITVNVVLIRAMLEAGYQVELGSLMAPTSNVEKAGKVLNKAQMDLLSGTGKYYSDSADLESGHIVLKSSDDIATYLPAAGAYGASVVGIQANATRYQTDFTCVAYMTFTKDGNTYTVYTQYDADAARNLYEIAKEAQGNQFEGYDSNERSRLEAIISAVEK